MRRADLLIVIILVASAVASAIGVATYTDTRTAATFDITWETRALALSDVTGTHAGAGETTLVVPVNVSSLLTLDFTVAVTGAVPRVQPTDVRIELTPPAGAGAAQVQELQLPAGATPGNGVTFTFNLTSLPNATRVTAGSVEEAVAKAETEAAATRGTGDWTLVISFAPTAPGPLGNEAHAVTVSPVAMVFEARASPETPEVAR